MRIAHLSTRLTLLVALLQTPSLLRADELIFHADFESDAIGSFPSAQPPSEPALDSIDFGLGSGIKAVSVQLDPDGDENQILECFNLGGTHTVRALVDPGFETALASDGLFEVAWSSSVGPDTDASVSLINNGMPSLWIRYDAGLQTLLLSDANGLAQSPSAPTPFAPGTEQQFQLRIDFEAEQFDLKVDGNLVAAGFPIINGAPKGLSEIAFSYESSAGTPPFMMFGSSISLAEFCIDDISATQLSTTQTHAVNYVRLPGNAPSTRKGAVPCILLGGPDFDLSEVDLASLQLNGAPLKRLASPKAKDVSGPDGPPDGIPDLMCHFESTPDLGTASILSGFLSNGDLLIGTPIARKPSRR